MRCIIYTAYLRGNARDAYMPWEDDFIICADGGYTHALAAGVQPQLVIGDGDSLAEEDVPPELWVKVPVEKDDTDTMLCIRHALQAGYQECLILGGIGGRLDHTLANLQTLAFAHAGGMRATLCDAMDAVILLEAGELELPRKDGFSLSLFSYTECCEGVYISGVKYPLVDALLTHAFPLGVSNEFAEQAAHICVRKGVLMIVLSRWDRTGECGM